MTLDELDIQRIAWAVTGAIRHEQCLKCGRIGSIYKSMCEVCGHNRHNESIFITPPASANG